MNGFAQSREDDYLFADEFEPTSDSTYKPFIHCPAQSEDITSKPSRRDLQHMNPQSPDRSRNDTFPSRRGKGRSTVGQHARELSSSPPPSDTTRVTAVRGDRSLTGGVSKVKLTEAELSAKLEKMRILNASKIEKHRLVEADQAAFQFRQEEILVDIKDKEKKERVQQLEMERERLKNREHKIKGIGRREWDSGKSDTDIIDNLKPRFGEYARGENRGMKQMSKLDKKQYPNTNYRNSGQRRVESNKNFSSSQQKKPPIDISNTGEDDISSSIGNQSELFFSTTTNKCTQSIPPHASFNSIEQISNLSLMSNLLINTDVKSDPVLQSDNPASPIKKLENYGQSSALGRTNEKPDWAEEMSSPIDDNKVKKIVAAG